MFNRLQFIKLERMLRRHWLVALCVAGFAGVLLLGAPAWAAPVARPLSQIGGTVPRPTATSEAGPVATATPRPDNGDDDDNEGAGQGGDTGSTAPADAPNIVFPQGPGGSSAATPSAGLTAQVTVNALNLREGPGTGFNTLGSLPANSQVTVRARSEDGAWWYVCCIPGTETTGWVSAQLLTPNFDRAQANTLIPLFGSEPAAPATTSASPTPEAPQQAEQPLEIDFGISPYFVWQGITATLTITVNNPNAVDAMNVVLSDELPEVLILIEAEADAGGTVETVTTDNGHSLLLFNWATIPADTAVTAIIVTQVAPDIADGTVIDNLVATRGRNIAYSTDVLTIGMPPVLQPDFQ